MRHESCDSAHRRVSVALDEGLSDLEKRLLDSHLAKCEECRAFEQRVRAITFELRAAQPVQLERQIELPPRRQVFTRVRVASASVAAVAAVAVFGIFALSTSGDRVQPSFANVRNTDAFDARAARRTQMVAPLPQRPYHHVQMAGEAV
jgi:predicted anti-sigma-YlaC factor YlaD